MLYTNTKRGSIGLIYMCCKIHVVAFMLVVVCACACARVHVFVRTSVCVCICTCVSVVCVCVFLFDSVRVWMYVFECQCMCASGGHSLCHSGNGIREWSGNRCMFAIPREFPFPFPFPPNSLGGGGFQSLQSRFSRQKTRNGTGGPK